MAAEVALSRANRDSAAGGAGDDGQRSPRELAAVRRFQDEIAMVRGCSGGACSMAVCERCGIETLTATVTATPTATLNTTPTATLPATLVTTPTATPTPTPSPPQLRDEMLRMREAHEAELEEAQRQTEELAREADDEVDRLTAQIQVNGGGVDMVWTCW